MNPKKILKSIVIVIIFALAFTPLVYALDITVGSDLVTPEYSKTISMDFKNAALNDVLKIFSQQSGLNFIASTEVADKTINLYLDQVPVEEALERILSANNLTYELKPGGNIFIVKELKQPKVELMTRVYRLKFATIPSSKLNNTFSITADSGGTSSTSSSSSSSTNASSGAASGGEGIVSAVQAILTTEGKVVEDKRTNSLIVSDIPNNFPMIEQTIARLDVRIPQILIEVEMLDISKGTADKLGAQFGDGTNFSPVQLKSGAEKTSIFPFNQDNAKDDGTFTGSTYNAGTLSFAGLKFTLDFLRTQSDTKNLARPRILTLDNETAEIKVTTNEVISVQNTTTTVSGGPSTTGSTAERTQTGVSLNVTPQVNLITREITLAIEPKVIQARTSSSFPSFKDPEQRGTKSILRIKDGDTIVIGGLLRTDLQDARTKVPVLGQIPLLGAAFRHKDKTESQRELVVFITPHIVKEDSESNVSSAQNKPFIREQDAPSQKSDEVDKDLTLFEKKRL